MKNDQTVLIKSWTVQSSVTQQKSVLIEQKSPKNLIFKSSGCQTNLSGQFIERVFSKVDLNGSKNIIRFEYLLKI